MPFSGIIYQCGTGNQEGDQLLLEQAIERLGLKVARTIADLAEEEHILTPHITEAISYRRLDRMEKNI